MQELRLVAVSEDGTYLVLATAGRGTRFTLPVDDRLRAAVRGNFSRLGQYEIEVESPLRPKEIQARIRAGETAEEIAATAGIPVERVRWFEGPVLQEREYVAQQAQRVTVRMPGETAAGPTLGELVAERLTRRGVPADEIDWDSAKRDDGLWRVKLGYVWNGHTRHAEWLFDPRRRHVSPHDDEAHRLSSADFDPDPVVEDTTVTPFAPRMAKLQPVPPLTSDPLPFPSVIRPGSQPEEPAVGYDPPARELPVDLPPAAFDRDPDPAPPARDDTRRGGPSPWLPDLGPSRPQPFYAPADDRVSPDRTAGPGHRHTDDRPTAPRPTGPHPDRGAVPGADSQPDRTVAPGADPGTTRQTGSYSDRSVVPGTDHGTTRPTGSHPDRSAASRPERPTAAQPTADRFVPQARTDAAPAGPSSSGAPTGSFRETTSESTVPVESAPTAAASSETVGQPSAPEATQAPTNDSPAAQTPAAPAAPVQDQGSVSSAASPQTPFAETSASAEPGGAAQRPEAAIAQSATPAEQETPDTATAPPASPATQSSEQTTQPAEQSTTQAAQTGSSAEQSGTSPTQQPESAPAQQQETPATRAATSAAQTPAPATQTPPSATQTPAPAAQSAPSPAQDTTSGAQAASSPAQDAIPAAPATPTTEQGTAPAAQSVPTAEQPGTSPTREPESAPAQAQTSTTSAADTTTQTAEAPVSDADAAAVETHAAADGGTTASAAAAEPPAATETQSPGSTGDASGPATEGPVTAGAPAARKAPESDASPVRETEAAEKKAPEVQAETESGGGRKHQPRGAKPAAKAVPAARPSKDDQAEQEPPAKEEPPAPTPAPKPARQSRKGSRGRRASVPTWDEIMFGARRQD